MVRSQIGEGISQIFVINKVRKGFGKRAAHPRPILLGVPPGLDCSKNLSKVEAVHAFGCASVDLRMMHLRSLKHNSKGRVTLC